MTDAALDDQLTGGGTERRRRIGVVVGVDEDDRVEQQSRDLGSAEAGDDFPRASACVEG